MIMEITLLIMEKSWKNHGILFWNFCGNPVLLPEIQESVQFIMIGVLRVKAKAVFISKPFQTPDKKIFDTDVCYNSITLCMLDKFSYFCHLCHVQFNIKKILGASPVRPFGRV